MSKEKEMLKAILANTKAIMEHLKINSSPAKQSEKASAAQSGKNPKATKSGNVKKAS